MYLYDRFFARAKMTKNMKKMSCLKHICISFDLNTFYCKYNIQRVQTQVLERKKILVELNKQMKKASKDLNFEEAIRLRDEIEKIKKI